MSGPNVEDYTPGWTVADKREGMWRKVDEVGVMHLLLQDGDLFFELHGMTLHIYSGPTEVADDVWPLGDPTKVGGVDCSHVATHDVSSGALSLYTDESDVWAWLVRYASNERAAR